MAEANLTSEVAVGMRLRSFEVVEYNPLPEGLVAFQYNCSCAFAIEPSKIEIKTSVTISDSGGVGHAGFVTLTIFDVTGLDFLPKSPEEGATVLPDLIMMNAITTALGATRGALVIQSNGHLLMPLMNLQELLPKGPKYHLVPPTSDGVGAQLVPVPQN